MTQSWDPWHFVIKMQCWNSFSATCQVPSCPKTDNWGRNIGLLMLGNHRWTIQFYSHKPDGPLKSRLTYQKQMCLPCLEIQAMFFWMPLLIQLYLCLCKLKTGLRQIHTHVHNTCYILWMGCNSNIDDDCPYGQQCSMFICHKVQPTIKQRVDQQ